MAPLVSVAVVIVVIALLVQGAPSHRGAPEQVHVQTGPVPAGPLTAIAGPTGSKAVDFADARVWVPSQWQIGEPGNIGCPRTAGGILLQPARLGPSCAHRQRPLVIVRLLDRHQLHGHVQLVNGYRIVSTGTNTYAVPELGVTITLRHHVPPSVLASLGPSPRAMVLASGSPQPIPSGWKQVSWEGVHVAVPPDLRVVRGNRYADCDAYLVAGEAVIGPPSLPSESSCTPFGPDALKPANGIWFGMVGTGTGYQTVMTPSGYYLQLRTSAIDDASPVLFLRGHGINLAVGLGRNPDIARAIFGSIR
jgi:hypothetical protein